MQSQGGQLLQNQPDTVEEENSEAQKTNKNEYWLINKLHSSSSIYINT